MKPEPHFSVESDPNSIHWSLINMLNNSGARPKLNSPRGLLDLPEHALRAIATHLMDEERTSGLGHGCRVRRGLIHEANEHNLSEASLRHDDPHEMCLERLDIHTQYKNQHLRFFWICRQLGELVPPFGLKYVARIDKHRRAGSWGVKVPAALRSGIRYAAALSITKADSVSHITILGTDTFDPPSDHCPTIIYLEILRGLTGLETLIIHDPYDEGARIYERKTACKQGDHPLLKLPNLRRVVIEGTAVRCGFPLHSIITSSAPNLVSIRVFGHKTPNANCTTSDLHLLPDRYAPRR